MNAVDWVLLGAAGLFALAGWHRGFIGSVLSFVGFIGGALAGAFLLPAIVDGLTQVQFLRVAIVGIGILICAILGQVAASIVGASVRRAISWTPAKTLDHILGAIVNVLALAVVAWIIAGAVSYLPTSSLSTQVSSSQILTALNTVAPLQARNAFTSLREVVGSTAVPEVFSGLIPAEGPEVDPPNEAAVTPAVDAVRESIVQINGDAEECRASVEGSGWVFAPGRVATNAHVVAGVDDLRVRVRLGDRGYRATVVYFDPKTDIAVLDVPELTAPAIPIEEATLATGDDAVVAGFPESGPYHAEPARIRTEVSAVGDDIYGGNGVEREVYVLRGAVRPGNSGGPLLTKWGTAAGMVFGSAENSESMAYALTAAAMADALTSPSHDEVDTGDCRVRD